MSRWHPAVLDLLPFWQRFTSSRSWLVYRRKADTRLIVEWNPQLVPTLPMFIFHQDPNELKCEMIY